MLADLETQTKTCSKCKLTLPLSSFTKDKYIKCGYRVYCKSCGNETNKKYREANKECIAETNKKWYEANKERKSETKKKWYEANKERIAETKKKWYEANKERIAETNKKWYEANKERVAETNKKWHEVNKDKKRSYTAKRRSIKLGATPPWLTKDDYLQIKDLYKIAELHGEITGKKYQLDHIHPLQAPKTLEFEGEMIPEICGLHVPWNLQILEESVNCSKSNKFVPYVESECTYLELWEI